MKILLDTHIILWHLTNDARLSAKNSALLEDPNVEKVVSLVSIWEIAIKVNIGKLRLQVGLDEIIPPDTTLLDLTLAHALHYQALPLHHRDPFDRMLIAQAQAENLSLMTDDSRFPRYPVNVII
jgi:PIN domain nuclease of toxin-antitoxin system